MQQEKTMDDLISFDIEPQNIGRYAIKNLKINPNLEFFERTFKHNNKKYSIKINCGYITFYKHGWFSGDKLLFFIDNDSIINWQAVVLVDELLILCKDKMQQYADRIKDFQNQEGVKSFKI